MRFFSSIPDLSYLFVIRVTGSFLFSPTCLHIIKKMCDKAKRIYSCDIIVQCIKTDASVIKPRKNHVTVETYHVIIETHHMTEKIITCRNTWHDSAIMSEYPWHNERILLNISLHYKLWNHNYISITTISNHITIFNGMVYFLCEMCANDGFTLSLTFTIESLLMSQLMSRKIITQ